MHIALGKCGCEFIAIHSHGRFDQWFGGIFGFYILDRDTGRDHPAGGVFEVSVAGGREDCAVSEGVHPSFVRDCVSHGVHSQQDYGT